MACARPLPFDRVQPDVARTLGHREIRHGAGERPSGRDAAPLQGRVMPTGREPTPPLRGTPPGRMMQMNLSGGLALTPTPLPAGEGLLLPSPPGRGWPAGPGEGTSGQAVGSHRHHRQHPSGEGIFEGEGVTPQTAASRPGRALPQRASGRRTGPWSIRTGVAESGQERVGRAPPAWSVRQAKLRAP